MAPPVCCPCPSKFSSLKTAYELKPCVIRRILATVQIAVALLLHYNDFSYIDLLGMDEATTPRPVAIEPDIASLMFIAAILISVAEKRERDHRPERQEQPQGRIKKILKFAVGQALMLVFADLVLRFIWVPFQYALYFTCIRGTMAKILTGPGVGMSQFEGFNRFVRLTHTKAGFIVLRNCLAGLLFFGALVYCGFVGLVCWALLE
jgi:hypothetical protein